MASAQRHADSSNSFGYRSMRRLRTFASLWSMTSPHMRKRRKRPSSIYTRRTPRSTRLLPTNRKTPPQKARSCPAWPPYHLLPRALEEAPMVPVPDRPGCLQWTLLSIVSVARWRHSRRMIYLLRTTLRPPLVRIQVISRRWWKLLYGKTNQSRRAIHPRIATRRATLYLVTLPRPLRREEEARAKARHSRFSATFSDDEHPRRLKIACARREKSLS